MRPPRALLAAALLCAAVAPAAADPCELNFIAHGTFRDMGACLLFEDDLGNFFEVVNRAGAWQDGMSGTAYAEFAEENVCGSEQPIEMCFFDADYTRFVFGTLIFRDFVECPGYTITTGAAEYLILNCDDFGMDLCRKANLGLRVQAEVFVDTGVSICLGTNRSVVLSYVFP